MAKNSSNSKQGKEHPLETLMKDAVGKAEDGELSVGKLIDHIGDRGFGPLLILPALIALLPPLGGIPGVPTAMGVLIFLMSVQLLFGRQRPWLPGWITKRTFDADKLKTAGQKASTVLAYIDTLVSPRLKWITGEAGKRLAAFACCLLALLMPPLELIPFGVAAPAAVVALFGIALTANDGVWMLAGLLLLLIGALLLGPHIVGAVSDLLGLGAGGTGAT